MKNNIENFVNNTLATIEHDDKFFNPWNDNINKDYDVQNAGEIRRNNLIKYLTERCNAKFIFIGEAPGFYGCRFSGIPFFDEFHMSELGGGYEKTSLKSPQKERTAKTFLEQKTLSDNLDNFVTWNIFPFHPYKKENGRYVQNKNGTPGKKLINSQKEITEQFFAFFPKAKIYAVGRKAEEYLKSINNKCEYIRHPSYGGGKEFNEACNGIDFNQ